MSSNDDGSAATAPPPAPGPSAGGAVPAQPTPPAPASSGGVTTAAWRTAKPVRQDYADVVVEMNSSRLVGEGGLFDRGPHVPITHMGYFKPPTDAFLTELRSRDRRSAKEWEYINAVGVWIETGLTALDIAKNQETETEPLTRKLVLAEKALRAAFEVVSMRAQYFRDITEHGIEMARQMSFLVEQGHDAVFSESYRSARKALTSKMEIEAAKMLAKARLERISGGRASASSDAE